MAASVGPDFESRVESSLVIQSFCEESLNNSLELGSFTPVPSRAWKADGKQ